MKSLTAHRCSRRFKGFTLPELMVSLTLGLFLIGGALTVFVSNRQIMLDKTAIDTAQEAARFGWHTLSRIVRLGMTVGNGSSDAQLVINYPRSPDVMDCLGNPVNDGTPTDKTDTFWLQGNQLVCNGAGNPIVGGVTSFSVSYGVPDADNWISDADFQDAADVAMADVQSVRIELSTDAGTVTFVATLRQRVFTEFGGGG